MSADLISSGPVAAESTLFDLLPVGAYRSWPDGRLWRANPALARLNACASVAELEARVKHIGMEWYVDSGRRAAFQQQLERHGELRGFISEVRRYGNGERIWVSENAHLLRAADGGVLGYEGTVEDVTERIQTQQALELSDRQLRQLSREFPGAVFRTRVARSGGPPRFEYVSDGVRGLYGVSPDELMLDGSLLQRMRHPDDAPDVAAKLAQARSQGRSHTQQFRIVHRDGSVRWVQGTTAVVDQDGDDDIRTGVILDVSVQREAEVLREQRDQAEASRRASAALLSRISHELRTPLNAVLGFAQLLEREPGMAPRSQGWAAQIVRSGRHLLGLVEDVLSLASHSGGELRLQLQPTALGPVLEDCRQLLADAAQAAGLQCTMPAQPLPAVQADPRRLRQILANLLSNAIKYNRAGGRVDLRVRSAQARVFIDVHDSGIGMAAEQLARLFQPFDRLGAEQSTVQGTGLGLALSRELAVAMHGSIEVSSQPGIGSCFTLQLPAAAQAD